MIFLSTCAATPVQVECLDRNQIAAELEVQYKETLRARGLTPRGHLVELFVSENDETWTLLLTMANGCSELFAAGSWWQSVVPQAEL